MTPDDRSHYSSFLTNPQQLGAWCLRVHLTEAAQTSFQTLLNLEPWQFKQGSKFRSRGAYDSYAFDIPPGVLVRLFAYLRACLPKSTQSGLPALAPAADQSVMRLRRNWSRSRSVNELLEMATPPPRLSPKKRATLHAAGNLFLEYFASFRCTVVPENPGKVDFRNSSSHRYFQASQEPQGMLKGTSG